MTPLQTAITRKREVLQPHVLIFSESPHVSLLVPLSQGEKFLEAIQKNPYFLIYKAW